jgi:hypothetical protein
LVKLSPSKYEAELPSVQSAVDGFKGVDSHLGGCLAVSSVEMRVAVIIEIHCDDDAEEGAMRGIGSSLAAW